MDKKTTVLIVILAILTVTSITLVYPVHAESNIAVLSSCSWVDSHDQYCIVGEVKNTGSTTASQVRLLITLYDSKNSVLCTFLTNALMDYIPPNTKSPFNFAMKFPNGLSNASSRQINHYIIEIQSSREGSVQEGLQILSHSLHIDSKEYMHIDGEIQNIGTAISNYTDVWATFYDSSGKAVDTALGYANPENVAPGNTSEFEIMNLDPTRTPLYTSYSLFAQGFNYAQITANLSQSLIPIQTSPTPSVQEFPILLILPLFAVIPLITVLILRKSSHLKAYN